MKFFLYTSAIILFLIARLEAFDEIEPNPDEVEGELIHEEASGPSKEDIQEMLEGMQLLRLRRTALNRRSAEEQTESLDIASYREFFGPQDENATKNIDIENTDALKSLALEGDMLLNKDQLELLNTGSSEMNVPNRSKRAVVTNSQLLWSPSVPIYYFIDSSSTYASAVIRRSINFWQANTCLTFQENARGSNRIRFYRGSGCFSYIGKQNWGGQDVSIGTGCEVFGTVTHEIGHALGAYHTQSRYDRDNYLVINWSNIDGSQQYNFQKVSSAAETHFGMAYDYGSVMQYNPYAFARNTNVPTSYARDRNYQNMMGQREGPSFSDLKHINTLYQCSRRCSEPITCNNRGIVNSRNCTECLCPKTFGGRLCNQLDGGNAPICNAESLQATTTWKSFTAEVGMTGTGWTNGDPVECNWHLVAPSGRRVQIQITTLSGSCVEGCNWNGFEINTGNFDVSGMLFCCSSVSGYNWTSTANRITIRGHSRYSKGALTFSYRTV